MTDDIKHPHLVLEAKWRNKKYQVVSVDWEINKVGLMDEHNFMGDVSALEIQDWYVNKRKVT